jgi:DNA-binding transcriptional regulator YiaG
MSNYQDPAAVRMEDGRTMADYMRRGPHGLKGVVVAAATRGGTPVNFDPHDASKTVIHIVDPSGRASGTITFDKFTKENVVRASAAAQQKYPGDDIDSVRERAAMAFEELAKIANSGVQTVNKPKAVATSQSPTRLEADEENIVTELREETRHEPAPPPIDKIDRDYSPMAAFGLRRKTTSLSAGQSAAPTNSRIGPPQKLVYFEKEGIGTVPAFFHDAIVATTPTDDDELEESGFLVLIYDLRYEQNAARWFPPSSDPYQRPWAAQINDDNKLYLVYTTGFQYVYDSREYCILRVERAVISSGA